MKKATSPGKILPKLYSTFFPEVRSPLRYACGTNYSQPRRPATMNEQKFVLIFMDFFVTVPSGLLGVSVKSSQLASD